MTQCLVNAQRMIDRGWIPCRLQTCASGNTQLEPQPYPQHAIFVAPAQSHTDTRGWSRGKVATLASLVVFSWGRATEVILPFSSSATLIVVLTLKRLLALIDDIKTKAQQSYPAMLGRAAHIASMPFRTLS